MFWRMIFCLLGINLVMIGINIHKEDQAYNNVAPTTQPEVRLNADGIPY